MIIATMNCIDGTGVFYFSLLIFYVRSPYYMRVYSCVCVSARVRYKPNTNFMTAIPDRFHPITIVGRPCMYPLVSIFARVQNKSILPCNLAHADTDDR